jgi:hypothetical protein
MVVFLFGIVTEQLQIRKWCIWNCNGTTDLLTIKHTIYIWTMLLDQKSYERIRMTHNSWPSWPLDIHAYNI